MQVCYLSHTVHACRHNPLQPLSVMYNIFLQYNCYNNNNYMYMQEYLCLCSSICIGSTSVCAPLLKCIFAACIVLCINNTCSIYMYIIYSINVLCQYKNNYACIYVYILYIIQLECTVCTSSACVQSSAAFQWLCKLTEHGAIVRSWECTSVHSGPV